MAKTTRCTTEEIKFSGLVIPKGTPFPNQGKPVKHPTNSFDQKFITLADHLNCVMRDPQGNSVFEYIYNRKDGSFNTAAAKSCREGMSKEGLGYIPVGNYKGKLTLAGWHSRTRGFLEGFLLGNLSESDLNTKIPVVFTDDFLKTYRHEGAKNISHGAAMQAVNPDFVFGCCRTALETQLGEVVTKRMRASKIATALNCILFAFHLENEGKEVNWDDWASMYQLRGKTNQISEEFGGFLHITEEQYQKLSTAINFWFALICEFEKQAESLKKLKDTYKKVSQIIKSGGFFGYVVTDRLGNRDHLRKDHSISVRNILNNLSESSEIATTLMRAKHYDVRNVVMRLDDIMRQKPKAA